MLVSENDKRIKKSGESYKIVATKIVQFCAQR